MLAINETRSASDDGSSAGRTRRGAGGAPYRVRGARQQPYEAIARQVIALRSRYRLSQEELAERIGTSHSQISRIESGHHRPSVETLRRIAQALDADLVISFEAKVA